MDFELARYNMIEQQIRPWDVLDQGVLDSLMVVKRELFTPPAYRAMAFSDFEIPLNLDGLVTGEYMFAPRVEARLLQTLALHKHESVIEVGTGSGYMAALLALKADRVMTYELHPELAAFARNNLHNAGVDNCEIVQRNGAELADDNTSSVDAIVLSGSVEVVPPALLERLKPGGRLIAIVGEAPVMQARLYSKTADSQINTQNLFETNARPLVGFPVQERFEF